MKYKELWVTGAALIAIIAVGLWAYRHVAQPATEECQICQRPVHAGVGFRLETAEGSKLACCPRCGMHLVVADPHSVRRAWATDLVSGDRIPASSAVYVEGGDVGYCTSAEKPIQREPQGVSVRAYDRCLPTLVAFKDPKQAEAYQAQHGGWILGYEQALERVKEQ